MDNSPTRQDILERLMAVLETRKPSKGGDPSESYVARLFAGGEDAILKKIGEETTELVLAAKNHVHNPASNEVLKESADLIFHWLVLLSHLNIAPQQVFAELARREGISGLLEKAQRKKTF